MAVDALMSFSSAQAVTATAVSTNVIDMGPTGFSHAAGLMKLAVTVDQSVAAAGAATVTFQLIGSASANLSSPVVLAQTDAIGKAELPAGRKAIALALPKHWNGTGTPPRYLGVNYLVGTGPLTAGQFTANLTDMVQDFGKIYGSGIGVS